MFASATTGTIIGVEAEPVVVEAYRAKGLPGTSLVGLARGAVKESLVRVKAAVNASGLSLGRINLVANLLPAELPKDGTALDLPLAVSLLAATENLPLESLSGRRFYGGLSLSGSLEPVSGAVLIADLSRRLGEKEIIVPRQNAAEAAIIPGVRVLAADSLLDVVAYLNGDKELHPAEPEEPSAPPSGVCMSEIRGQERAKRALEIAAAGGHNLLLIGPPGSGKTMLARRIPTILPPLGIEESIEVTRIFSASGLLREHSLHSQRPFRAPHHTASEAAICGGGTRPRPGEVTLAHRGVLFLDELPEFSRKALESLREPLEEGTIHIARASMSITFPASVLLVAAMNPCPCGYYSSDAKRVGAETSALKACTCTFEQVQRYRSRLSGPLLDRIDMHVWVDALSYRDFVEDTESETSSEVR
ncbi:YifB family Mg chelatase-like AAA ATPase, partial [Myxococcota bacterium]|nr:YifB family Mg chelatase-like AAA ATPase [Myxococcota bacterium]